MKLPGSINSLVMTLLYMIFFNDVSGLTGAGTAEICGMNRAMLKATATGANNQTFRYSSTTFTGPDAFWAKTSGNSNGFWI